MNIYVFGFGQKISVAPLFGKFYHVSQQEAEHANE